MRGRINERDRTTAFFELRQQLRGLLTKAESLGDPQLSAHLRSALDRASIDGADAPQTCHGAGVAPASSKLLQLLYVSSANGAAIDLDRLLSQAQRNNAREGVTGLLYADNHRFLQVLEGEPEAVERVFARLRADPRHRATVILSRRSLDTREFGDWSMARLHADERSDVFAERLRAMCRDADPTILGTFAGLSAVRQANIASMTNTGLSR